MASDTPSQPSVSPADVTCSCSGNMGYDSDRSSFGWYDESAAFESMDAAAHPACCQIDDWRNLETWDGGKEHERQDEVGSVCSRVV